MLKYLGVLTGISLLLLLGLNSPSPLHAAGLTTFTVNSDLDELDKKPGDGVCLSKPSKKCTLRAAIQETNALGAARTIKLPAGNYVLSRSGAGEDKAKTGDLDIKSQITIKGASADTTIIDGGGIDRVFDIHSGMLSLTKLTVQNGTSPTDNGGGIYVHAGTLKTKLTRISSNATSPSPDHPSNGGGIYNKGTTLLVQTLVTGNVGWSGSAIENDGGRLEITSGLVYANFGNAAGAVYLKGTTTITNSTINGNGSGTGGGLYTESGNVSLYNVTIAENGASAGGGIYNDGATVYLRNTIIEANYANSSAASCSGTLTSGDYNIINPKDTGCTITGITTHNQYDPPASLYVLRDDGGFTMTNALVAASPAVDGGNPAGCKDKNSATLTIDQRGMPRPTDGDGAGGARCDVGASEFQP